MIARRLSQGRLHLSDGPIDLIVKADGEADAVEAAYRAAERRLDGLLAELASELPLLRARLGAPPPPLAGAVARRMAEAAWPYRYVFVTPMIAVAGAVAEAVLAAMVAAATLSRAFVNDGGDIAVHLAPGAHIDIGVVRSIERGIPEAYLRIDAGSPVRGVATSGWRGRSYSLGIADAVTVLATTAAGADAAATMIANAVYVRDPAVVRLPACELDPDSDLINLPVTVAVGLLSREALAAALAAGRARARKLIEAGLIVGALISLAGRWESVGEAVLVGPAGESVNAMVTGPAGSPAS